MVTNRRPVGKVFKRKKVVNSDIKSQNFKLKDAAKFGSNGIHIKHNQKSKINEKSIVVKVAGDNVRNANNIANEISKKTKWQKNEQNKSSLLPLDKTSENKIDKANTSPVTKRKFGEIDTTSPVQEKLQAKVLKSSKKGSENDNISSAGAKPSSDNPLKPNKKWKRKKKKKKPSVADDSSDTQYKPVWIVRGPKDFSANWKNLKEIITQGDKEQSAKIKEAEERREKAKQYKKMIASKKQEANKDDKSMKGKLEKVHKKQSIKHKETKMKKDEIWFDNVDPLLLGEDYEEEDSENTEEIAEEGETDKSEKEKKVVKDPEEGVGKAVAIDCEMVGVGLNGKESMLARVSIVDQYCKVIYDKYVAPQEPVVDYRTEFSGIRPEDIADAWDFKTVQSEVAKILQGKILVGHGLQNDLRALFLQHPRSRIRDTARFKPFKTMFRGHTPKLKMLTKRIVGVDIQSGEHDSVQDAQAVMRIYTVHHQEWDKMKKKTFKKPKKKKVPTEEVPPTI